MRLFMTLIAAILLASGVPDNTTPSCGILYDSIICGDCIEIPDGEVKLDESEVEYLACAIYCEVGADYIADETRYMVGDVILNRVADPRFPDTIEGVLTQKRQYGRFYWTGIVWPSKASSEKEKAAVERAYQTARDLLSDTRHSILYGDGYVFQSENHQSKDEFYADGIWFGR